MKDEQKKKNELEFEELMKLRMQGSANSDSGLEIADERLKEMSKKLPSWSLEPPSTFLRCAAPKSGRRSRSPGPIPSGLNVWPCWKIVLPIAAVSAPPWPRGPSPAPPPPWRVCPSRWPTPFKNP